MNIQLELPQARNSDPITSHQAAADLARVGGQRAELLAAYASYSAGLTDEEAGAISGLAARGAGFWKRCSDLRRAGLIEITGQTRLSSAGKAQQVCMITEAGRKVNG